MTDIRSSDSTNGDPIGLVETTTLGHRARCLAKSCGWVYTDSDSQESAIQRVRYHADHVHPVPVPVLVYREGSR